MPIGSDTDFSQAILEEAKKEADEILDLARREAEKIMEGAREELDQVYIAESPDIVKQRAKTRYNQIVAAAELETRKRELLLQERLITEVLQRAKERLSEIRSQSQYPTILESLIRTGVTQLDGDPFEIIVAPEDHDLITPDMLDKLCKETGKTIMLSEQSQPHITGAIVQRADERVICDNSFQAILQRRQEELRLLIAQELFGGVEAL